MDDSFHAPRLTSMDDFLPEPGSDHGGCSDIEVLRLTDSPVLCALFTSKMLELRIHYVDYASLRGDVRCNVMAGKKCILCALGRKSARRGILPVYCIASGSVQ